jgi:hypothetical protein
MPGARRGQDRPDRRLRARPSRRDGGAACFTAGYVLTRASPRYSDPAEHGPAPDPKRPGAAGVLTDRRCRRGAAGHRTPRPRRICARRHASPNDPQLRPSRQALFGIVCSTMRCLRLVTTVLAAIGPVQPLSASTRGSIRPGSGLSLGLIHPRPGPFTGGHPDRVCAVRGRWRTLVNAGQHCWKACWGQPLRSSNLLSSATSDQALHNPGHASGLGLPGCVGSFVVSFILRISV